MSDNVNHPKHYTQAGVMLEPIDVIRFAPFDLGNAIKYICRAGHKNDELEDYRKAQKYLNWAVESYLQDPVFYDEFVSKYGLLLYKLKPFEDASNGSTSFEAVYWDIQWIISQAFSRLENGQEHAQ